MSKVHIVIGTTGEYSDRYEWPVKAFLDVNRARDLVARASESAREYLDTVGYVFGGDADLSKVNPHDPHFKMDYTGTTYFVMTVELDEDA